MQVTKPKLPTRLPPFPRHFRSQTNLPPLPPIGRRKPGPAHSKHSNLYSDGDYQPKNPMPPYIISSTRCVMNRGGNTSGKDEFWVGRTNRAVTSRNHLQRTVVSISPDFPSGKCFRLCGSYFLLYQETRTSPLANPQGALETGKIINAWQLNCAFS